MGKGIHIGRRIGFDFGEKRIGVAVSDLESILVSPYATILNDDKLQLKVEEIIKEVNPIYIAIGDPKHLSGKTSHKSSSVRIFAELIRSLYMGPIYLIDERYTTSNAYSKLRELGYSEKQGRAVIDQIAAISLLDSAIANEKAGQNIGEMY